jgi:hypothetical protein
MTDLRRTLIAAGAHTPWLIEHTVPFVAEQVITEALDAMLTVLADHAEEWGRATKGGHADTDTITRMLAVLRDGRTPGP